MPLHPRPGYPPLAGGGWGWGNQQGEGGKENVLALPGGGGNIPIYREESWEGTPGGMG